MPPFCREIPVSMNIVVGLFFAVAFVVAVVMAVTVTVQDIRGSASSGMLSVVSFSWNQ